MGPYVYLEHVLSLFDKVAHSVILHPGPDTNERVEVRFIGPLCQWGSQCTN